MGWHRHNGPERLLFVRDAMDGFEPPYKVLQTYASPLGHMALFGACPPNDSYYIFIFMFKANFLVSSELLKDLTCTNQQRKEALIVY